MAEVMVTDAMEMCDVRAPDGLILSTVSLAIGSVMWNVLDEGVVAGHIQSAASTVDMHPLMIEAASNALLKNDNLIAPIVNFVLNYIDKASNRVKKKAYCVGSRKKVRGVPPSLRTSVPLTMTTFRSEKKKFSLYVVTTKARRCRVCLHVLFQDDVWSVKLSDRPNTVREPSSSLSTE